MSYVGILKKIIKRRMRVKAILILVLLLFGLLCLGYYLSNKMGSFPDERAHLGYVSDVIDRGFPDYKYGLIPETAKLNYLPHPSLYYVVAGGIFRLMGSESVDENDIEKSKNIRSVNFFISVLTLIVVYYCMRGLGLKLLPMWFGLTFLLCIPMFAVLSVSVSNDPLATLGCTLVIASFIYFYDRERAFISLSMFLAGIVIAFLSKATAALAVVCLVFFYAALNFQLFIGFVLRLSKGQIVAVFASIFLIFIYYGVIYQAYGEVFPAPQGNPSDWYLVNSPNAPRWPFFEYVAKFYESNLNTLTKPYGHIDFPDLPQRELILNVIIAVLPVFAIIGTYGERRHQSVLWKLIAVFVFSFLVFMVVYLLKIRNMHMSTGYPGAMQARYFFGFLPAAAIIYAIGFSHIRNEFLRLSFVLLILAGLVLSFYPAYCGYFQKPDLAHMRSNTNYGELISNRQFEQTFVANCSKLEKVELLLATYARTNTGTVSLKIASHENSTLAVASVSAESIRDNTWVAFSFSGLSLKYGEKYGLRLVSTTSMPGDAITWWAAERKEEDVKSKYIGTPYGPPDPMSDYFPEGEAIVDDEILNADFAFRIYCEK